MEVKQDTIIDNYGTFNEAEKKYNDIKNQINKLDEQRLSLVNDLQKSLTTVNEDIDKYAVWIEQAEKDILQYAINDNKYKQIIKDLTAEIETIGLKMIYLRENYDMKSASIQDPLMRQQIYDSYMNDVKNLENLKTKYESNIVEYKKQKENNQYQYEQFQKQINEKKTIINENTKNYEQKQKTTEQNIKDIDETKQKLLLEVNKIIKYMQTLNNKFSEKTQEKYIQGTKNKDDEILRAQQISYTHKINSMLDGKGSDLPQYENKISIEDRPIKAINYDLNGVGTYVQQVKQLLEPEFELNLNGIYESKNIIQQHNELPFIEILKYLILYGGSAIVLFALAKFSYNLYYYSDEINKKEDKKKDAEIDMQIIDKNAEIQKLQIKKDIN